MKIRDIVAIVAVALAAGSCNQKDDGLQPDDRVPIRLKASVEADALGLTRAAGDWGERTTTQGTEFLNDGHVLVYIKENDGTHTSNIKWPIEYKVVNDGDGDADDGDLDPVSDTTPFYFPTGVNTIQMHGIHPSSYTSGEGFTVMTDQTTEANYAASDLCYSKPTDYSRTGTVDANGRRVLQFKHLLSKIVVNLTVDAVSATGTPDYISLHAKTSTEMAFPIYADDAVASDEDKAKGYTGCTPSDAYNSGIIKMKQEAIIPPQTIAAGASFISLTVPGIGPMIYPLPATTTFESGKKYTYNLKVTDVAITANTDINNWNTDPGTITGLGKKARPVLPIEYVAQTNMYNATTFAANNKKNTSCFMNWDTAYGYYNSANGTQLNLTGQSCTGESYSTWHLPTFAEVSAVIPSPNLTTGNAYILFNATSLLYSSETLEWGWNGSSYNVSGTFYSEYKNVTQNYAYAVRYKETSTAKGGYGRYTTAFRYELRTNYPESGDESLIIRWKWLGDSSSDILSNSSDDIIGKESYWSTYDGECVIPRVGFYSYGNANAGTTPSGANAHYWTSTSKDGTMKYLFYYNSATIGDTGTTYFSTRDKVYGFTVRLFADAE